MSTRRLPALRLPPSALEDSSPISTCPPTPCTIVRAPDVVVRKTPLILTKASPCFSTTPRNHPLRASRSTSPSSSRPRLPNPACVWPPAGLALRRLPKARTRLKLRPSPLGGTGGSTAPSRKCASSDKTLSNEKDLILMTCPRFTLPCRQGTTRMAGLTSRIRAAMVSRLEEVTWSHLFRRQTSLMPSCSLRRRPTPWEPSAPAAPPSKASKFPASQTQITPSSWKAACTKGSAKKVCATGITSESPEHSMIRPSSWGAAATASAVLTSPATAAGDLCAKRRSASTRSPRTRQQRHPFGMTTTSVSLRSTSMSSSSTETLPNSFCTTPMRCPCP
mmetsp:Transcript_16218/g.36636  ORF Transcript_16218/g.36636 Transcript_16218/m.36636 type:complete len:334 (+) Transcript_16218:157-1158(+)